jgi:hypothetical protein
MIGCGSPPEPVRRFQPAGECVDGDESQERWGTDCGCCHQGEFSVAGSVSQEAAVERVVVEDAAGTRLEMIPNPYRNFFRHAPLVAPLRANIVLIDGRVRAMKRDAPHGSCNRCHAPHGDASRIGQP